MPHHFREHAWSISVWSSHNSGPKSSPEEIQIDFFDQNIVADRPIHQERVRKPKVGSHRGSDSKWEKEYEVRVPGKKESESEESVKRLIPGRKYRVPGNQQKITVPENGKKVLAQQPNPDNLELGVDSEGKNKAKVEAETRIVVPPALEAQKFIKVRLYKYLSTPDYLRIVAQRFQ